MKSENPELDTLEDARKIAKRWYTEQRGRRLGNTVDWDNLGDYGRHLIIDRTLDLLYAFSVAMRPEPTPVEEREKHVEEPSD